MIPSGIFMRIKPFLAEKLDMQGGKKMKQEEKKPITWEAADPKPPVVQSGHLENKKAN